MGLPEILIAFKTRSASAIKRSARGIVTMILKDETKDDKHIYYYNKISDVENSDWDADSNKYILQVFKNDINKLIVLRVDSDNTLEKALNTISKESFNYICYPKAQSQDNEKIASFIKSQRKLNKIYKAVLSNSTSDHEGIINYVSTCVDDKGDTYTPDKYTPRIAGILASIPFDISSTYYRLDDVTDVVIDDIDNQGTQVDNGKLILIKDDGIVKIARGVNSLTSTSVDKGADFSKIRIIEIIDMIKTDIYKTLKDNYIGKMPNTYDNKMMCVSVINSYLKDLARDNILDLSSDNRVDIDVDAHVSYIMRTAGVAEDEINKMSEQQIRKYNTGSYMYLSGKIKPVDCVEDIKINISI